MKSAEEIERDRVRTAQKLERTRAALIELKDLIVEKDRKIFYYRVKTLVLSVALCFFVASTVFLSLYPEKAKVVNACLSNTISILKTDSKGGYPSDSSIRAAEGQSKEGPAKDATTDGSGSSSREPAGRNYPIGSEDSKVLAGLLRE